MPVTTTPAAASPAKNISCIICAFNEAPRIGAVLAVASAHPLIAEVIVVDDGSSDGTAERVAGFASVKLHRLPANQGKSAAMAVGIAAARHELLMLLDADLQGLTPRALSTLAEPVLAGSADVSLSLRQNSLWLFRRWGLDFVTGERVLRRDVLSQHLHTLRRLPGFGLEVFMNRLIVDRACRIAVVEWAGVSQSRKTRKLGYAKGLLAELRMTADLLNSAAPHALLLQFFKMRALRCVHSPAAPDPSASPGTDTHV